MAAGYCIRQRATSARLRGVEAHTHLFSTRIASESKSPKTSIRTGVIKTSVRSGLI
jgi:hypothetical protein